VDGKPIFRDMELMRFRENVSWWPGVQILSPRSKAIYDTLARSGKMTRKRAALRRGAAADNDSYPFDSYSARLDRDHL